MKKNIILLPLLMLALASCGGNSNNNGSGQAQPSTSSATSIVQNFETVSYTIAGSLPEGLTYITNNEKFPNPEFYKESGIKIRFENIGVSTTFNEFTGSLNVTIDIALNPNSKTSAASTHVFTITALNASGSDCGVAYLDSVTAGTNTVKIDVTKATSLKVVMTGYPSAGDGKYNNVNFKGLTIAKAQ